MQQVDQYVLDTQNPQIFFILGGPGSGKGTQCERLVRDYHFEHISVGEVIRETIEREGDKAAKLREMVTKGELVPDPTVVECLDKVIKSRKVQKFLIDGFPRSLDQAKLFEAQVKEIDLIVNIECEEQVLIDRLTKRGLSGARADDNEETIKNRIKVYNEKTVEVSDYYNKFGKIKHVNGNLTVDEVYKQVRKSITPNLIFFMGPPAVGKTTVARRLAEKIKYLFVDLEEFSRQHRCKNQQELSNALMAYCQGVPHNCIVIDSFFTDHNQAEVFFNHFAEPQYVFYLDSPKSEVYMNISKYYNDAKRKKYQQNVYQQYIVDRQGLLKLMQGKPYFKQINAAQTLENILFDIMQIQKPLTLVSFDHNNRDLACEYYYTMEQHRQYMSCDIEELLQHESDRQTQLGKKLYSFLEAGKKPSNTFTIEMIQKIMFNEPKNRRFIFNNWPQNQSDFEEFESELYPIDYLLNFQQPGQEYTYHHIMNAYLHYFSKGKVINIDKNRIDILDSYTTNRQTYGFVFGPQFGGKTTISKYVAEKFDYELVDFTNEAFIEAVKKKTIKEDDEVQDVGFPHILAYFADRLNPNNPKSKTVIFDGFPYSQQEMEQLIQKVGQPTFVLNLRVTEEQFVKRFKLKNEMEAEAEIGEEQQQQIAEILKKSEEQTEFWEKYAENEFSVTLYNINADLPLQSTQRYTNQIFQKRVFMVSDYLDYNDQNQEYLDKTLEEAKEDQRLIFINLCANKNITFVDVSDIIDQHYKKQSSSTAQQLNNQYEMRWTRLNKNIPSNYSPEYILKIIQEYLDTLKNPTRDILLYNYPSADQPGLKNENEKLFPRPSDELKLIEENLGPVRFLAILTKAKKEHVIQDELMELEKPPEKPKPAEGEEGEGEAEAEAEAEGEEGVPKFNIYDHQWTKCDGLPKTLPQWFNKTRKTQKKHYSLQKGSEYTFDKLKQYLELIDEENEQNKEEEDFRKVNVFLQLRYDNVEEENEEDPPEVESEPEDNGQDELENQINKEGEDEPQQENQEDGEENQGEEGEEDEN